VNFIRRASVPVLKDSEFKCGLLLHEDMSEIDVISLSSDEECESPPTKRIKTSKGINICFI
jgi:hypothetical protein